MGVFQLRWLADRRFHHGRLVGALSARELDDEDMSSWIRLVLAYSGGNHFRLGIVSWGRRAGPVDRVFEFHHVAFLGQHYRFPEGDDIVVELVLRRQLNELYEAIAPVALRFDPDGRAQMVIGLHVLIIGERAVALHQAIALKGIHPTRDRCPFP